MNGVFMVLVNVYLVIYLIKRLGVCFYGVEKKEKY